MSWLVMNSKAKHFMKTSVHISRYMADVHILSRARISLSQPSSVKNILYGKFTLLPTSLTPDNFTWHFLRPYQYRILCQITWTSPIWQSLKTTITIYLPICHEYLITPSQQRTYFIKNLASYVGEKCHFIIILSLYLVKKTIFFKCSWDKYISPLMNCLLVICTLFLRYFSYIFLRAISTLSILFVSFT